MTSLRLHDIERNAWRMTRKDGLLDILFGFMFLGAGVSAFVGTWSTPDWAHILSLTIIQFGGVGIITWLRRRLVVPRMGHVKFSAKRKNRSHIMRILLAICVGATVALVVATILLQRLGPGSLGSSNSWRSWGVISAVVLIPIGMLSFFWDHPRLLLHGSLFVVAEFCLIVLGLEKLSPYAPAIAFCIGSAISFSIGIPIFACFLRSVPRIAQNHLGGLDD